tara:strand:+ start:177 stop:440 length:264 start_codon:yes stop_codon:yes gene_type:complete
MFLVKIMIYFYILIILGSIMSKIRINLFEGMESLDPLTQAKLNKADIIKLEKEVKEWNIDKLNKDISDLNEKCGEAIKARDEMKSMG